MELAWQAIPLQVQVPAEPTTGMNIQRYLYDFQVFLRRYVGTYIHAIKSSTHLDRKLDFDINYFYEKISRRSWD